MCGGSEAGSYVGSGFRVQGSGFRVQGSGFRVQGSPEPPEERGLPGEAAVESDGHLARVRGQEDRLRWRVPSDRVPLGRISMAPHGSRDRKQLDLSLLER